MNKDTLPIAALFLISFLCIVFAHITQNPDSPARAWVDNVAAPAMKRNVSKAIKRIPFSGLLAWPDSTCNTLPPTAEKEIQP